MFDQLERSEQDATPIELYQFIYGDVIQRFSSASETQLYNGYLWQPRPLQRGSIEQSTERGRNALQINCSRDFEIADLFRATPPTQVITVSVFRVHQDTNDVAVIWMGRVLSCEFKGAMATLNCEPVHSSLQRVGLRRMYQRQCPHVLYSTQCGASLAVFGVTATVESMAGVTLTAPELATKPDGYFAGGFIQIGNEYRFIKSHVGNQVTLTLQIALDVGASVNVAAGCDHTLRTCAQKFNNHLNYGGMPNIPNKNPFGGAIF